MIARTLVALVLLVLMDAPAAERITETYGKFQILEVSSAELPSVLLRARAKIGNVGFADKWEMPVEVLNQDLVVADQITLLRGRQLVLAPRNADGDNIVFFIARTLRVAGDSGQPVNIIWERNTPGLLRDPIKAGKASNGLAGEREGSDGKPGMDGVVGNRGLGGRDAPLVVFIAMKLEAAGPVRFQFLGQDGALGGAGQDGGDGGPGRAGRPGSVAANSIGIQLRGGSGCEPPIRGGNGGSGGNGGPGGGGGQGGDGGNIAIIVPGINADLVRRFVDSRSEFTGGKGGLRGARGIRGKGGPGGPSVSASTPCDAAPPGVEGAPGSGRASDGPPVPDVGDPGRAGEPGTVVFSSLSESQARSIGLLPGEK